ncbi:kinase D-interacting substrate of 220 kDa-like [Chelonus insularis]|uniref:kinase D-interacting substrate of 220 kDa-like n=1 Tax=Chelonus insularis TaxID=460826 RepID=UPI00158B5D1F|nr:kinase D-interacting substrate of 220 kDa-like [Chelonus insularis]XP_034935136.1 kinase D-interacting substrate of 220 kDa-like [Chelonus insularis]
MRLNKSIASSIGSNLNRFGGAQDLNKMLLTDDYFSDVNPRSMRRLMNVFYVMGRLLKAFQIDFNWYHLASWINITVQWPFKPSWMILHYEMYEDTFEDSMSLKTLYDKIRSQIPVLKNVQLLLEMDRDERKLDVFLIFHRSSLLISDMRIFLPFTINLDLYIKNKIKEEQQSIEEDVHLGIYKNQWQKTNESWIPNRTNLTNRHAKLVKTPSLSGPPFPPLGPWAIPPVYDWHHPWVQIPPTEPPVKPLPVTTTLPSEILEIKLSIKSYKSIVRENNITRKVLFHCDLSELKQVLNISFGDWEIFRIVIVSLREQERSVFSVCKEGSRSVRFTVRPEPNDRKETRESQSSFQIYSTHGDKEKPTSRTDGSSRRDPTKYSIMEKQCFRY